MKDRPLSFDASKESLYCAARALPTAHGKIHVQRAGLQKVAQHGIFHTPLAADEAYSSDDEQNFFQSSRTGYRVAIPARITHSNATDRLRPFLQRGLYRGFWGPKAI